METKSRVRRELLSRRKALSPEEISEKSARICQKLLAEDWYMKCRKILLYSAVRNEVDLSPFIEQAWRDEKQLYFPKVFGESMDFFPVDNWHKLYKGAFGVREPLGEGEPFCAGERTIMLVPGVAFSLTGGRIGYGKGYYDRYLSREENRNFLIPIGIAFELQLVDRFETESNDRNMQMIITENREVVFHEGFIGIM